MILVTGASGLIGSHLCKRLVSEGYDVVGLVHNRYNPIIETLLGYRSFNVVGGDIRKQNDVWRILRDYKPKTVFHIAAHLPYTLDKDVFGVNVGGTITLLNTIHNTKVEEFIFASSMGVYSAPPSYIPVDEVHPTQPSTEYGLSKLASELLCSVYRKSMIVTILRYAGVYGLSSEKSRAVNNFIRCALKDKPLFVDGDGSHSSDFTYVDDIVEGTYLAWQRRFSGIYNIGSGQDITIKELAELIIKLTNSKSEIVINHSHIDRLFRFFLDISKARNDFGYSPRLLEDGLRAYVGEFSE